MLKKVNKVNFKLLDSRRSVLMPDEIKMYQSQAKDVQDSINGVISVCDMSLKDIIVSGSELMKQDNFSIAERYNEAERPKVYRR